MTQTLEIVRKVLNRKGSIEVLECLSQGDKTFSAILQHSGLTHNTQLDRTLKILNQLALIEHVHTEHGSFYRINKRGLQILELVRAIGEEPVTVPCQKVPGVGLSS